MSRDIEYKQSLWGLHTKLYWLIFLRPLFYFDYQKEGFFDLPVMEGWHEYAYLIYTIILLIAILYVSVGDIVNHIRMLYSKRPILKLNNEGFIYRMGHYKELISWREVISIERSGCLLKNNIVIKFNERPNKKLEKDFSYFMHWFAASFNKDLFMIETKHIKGRTTDIFDDLTKYYEQYKSNEVDLIDHLIEDD